MNDGVTVLFELILRPEGVEPFKRGRQAIVSSPAKFPGFRSLRIVQHGEEPTRVLFVEEWDRAEDYDHYIRVQTEKGTMDALAAMMVSARTEIWPTLIARTD